MRSDRALRVTLELATAASWLLSSVAMLESPSAASSWPSLVAAIALLIVVPIALPRLPRTRSSLLARSLAGAGTLLALATCLWASRTGLFSLAILAAGVLHARSEETGYASASLGLPALVVTIALVLVSSTTLLLAFPLAVAGASVGGVLLHARAVAASAAPGSGAARRGPAQTPRAQGARLRMGLSLAAGLLIASLLGTLALEAAVSSVTDPPAEARAPVTSEAFDASPSLASGAQRPPKAEYQSDLNFGGIGAGALSDEVVMHVRPTAISGHELPLPGAGNELYLVGTSLDTFSADGISVTPGLELYELRDADDGRADGWTRLREQEPEEQLVGLDVRVSVPLRAGSAGSVVLAPRALLALSLPRVLLSDEHYLLAPGDPRAYRQVFDRREVPEASLSTAACVPSLAHALQLPPQSAALSQIRALARSLVDGLGSDYAKVRAIRNHLRDTFEYDLEGTGFGGPRAIAEFLERGSGFCTYSAGAMALMLRSLGLPARVVTGFLAREWSEEEGGWIVRRRHGHAWVEVPFEGFGWVRFDPTPIARGRGDFAASTDDPLARFLSELLAWSSSGGSEVELSQVLASLVAIPLRVLRERPSLALLLAAGLLAALATWRARRARRASGDELGPWPAIAPGASLQRRLLRALAAAGLGRARGQTAREFAAAAPVAGELYRPLSGIVELFYRARFGGRALVAQESEEVERFIERLEAHARRSAQEPARARAES